MARRSQPSPTPYSDTRKSISAPTPYPRLWLTSRTRLRRAANPSREEGGRVFANSAACSTIRTRAPKSPHLASRTHRKNQLPPRGKKPSTRSILPADQPLSCSQKWPSLPRKPRCLPFRIRVDRATARSFSCRAGGHLRQGQNAHEEMFRCPPEPCRDSELTPAILRGRSCRAWP